MRETHTVRVFGWMTNVGLPVGGHVLGPITADTDNSMRAMAGWMLPQIIPAFVAFVVPVLLAMM